MSIESFRDAVLKSSRVCFRKCYPKAFKGMTRQYAAVSSGEQSEFMSCFKIGSDKRSQSYMNARNAITGQSQWSVRNPIGKCTDDPTLNGLDKTLVYMCVCVQYVGSMNGRAVWVKSIVRVPTIAIRPVNSKNLTRHEDRGAKIARRKTERRFRNAF